MSGSKYLKKRNAYLLICLLFLAVGSFSWNLFFREHWQVDTVNIHRFPRQIQGWESQDLKISEDEYAILETRNVFTRRYSGPKGEIVYLMMVYSQHNRKVSHPPEICYTGSGATILSNEPAVMDFPPYQGKVRANRLFIEQGNTEQVMYYLFKVGDDLTSNYWKQQILVAWKTLFGQPSSSALIRISSTVDRDGPAKAINSIESFARIFSPLLKEYLP
ncbi:MAG: EpsI family protein [Candidatus Omnitrophota bacterium]|nr:EpsI family protein [Candidatus Omnitrophota bacterium]